MKSIIVFLAVAVAAPQTIQAQGTIYLSNLDQPSAGSLAVGSDSWLAAIFETGTNAAGYVLNSIQLATTDASGNPSGFRAMIYDEGYPAGGSAPGSSLGTLNGSLSPVTSGIYTYTPAATLTLSPRTPYYIVLTAGTAVADGAYEWSVAGTNAYHPSGGWSSSLPYVWTSGNGSFWLIQTRLGYLQFAIDATAIPEPGVLSLFVLGGFVFVWHRRKAKARDGTALPACL